MLASSLPLWVVELWPALAWFVIHFLWVGTLVWLVGITARFALRRAGAEIRYLLAIVVFVGLIAGSGFAVALAQSVQTRDLLLLLPASASGNLNWIRSLLLPVLPLIWAGGTTICGAAMAAGVMGVTRLRRVAPLPASAVITAAAETVCRTLRVTQTVSVLVSDRVRLPIVLGIVRPVVLLPAAACLWSARQIEHILLHEIAHVRRHDNLVTLVQRLFESLLWFHPAVWSVSRWLDEEREYCCDELVLAVTDDAESYASSLIGLAMGQVGQASRLSHVSLSASATGGPLDVRIRRILFREELTMSRFRLWEVIATAACCLLCSLALVGRPLEVRANPPAAEEAPAVERNAIPSAEIEKSSVLPPAPQQRQAAAAPALAPAAAKRPWGPEQVTGKPDTATAGDQVTAWASLSPDDSEEWLICQYEKAVELKSVRVHATFNPGAVFKVTAFKGGEEVLAWEGDDPTPRDQPKGVSVMPVKLDFAVQKIKIYIDSPAVPGWNEIDAVGLEDKDGEVHWAVAATASTTYAEPTTVAAGGKRSWGPEQAAGEPDTMQAGDFVTAWASASPDAQKEWLLCEYKKSQQAAEIVVHETFNPGAVYRITAFNPDGNEVLAWEGDDPTPRDQQKGVSVFPVKLDFAIKKIKVYIDSPAVPGWNEIDAVGLRDAKGETQWADKVEASTTFAMQGGVPVQPSVPLAPDRVTQLLQEFEQLKREVNELKQLRDDIKEIKELLKQQAKP